MKKSEGFISGRSSDWTKIGVGIASSSGACRRPSPSMRPRDTECKRHDDNALADARLHGYSAKTSHQTRSETDSDTIAAAGDQAAADVDVRAVGSAQPGNGREPDARGGPHRGTAAGGNNGAAGE